MKLLLLALYCLVIFSCVKNRNTAKCYDENSNFGFTINELVADTVLQTDTVFQNRLTFFKANENYTNLKWTFDGNHLYTDRVINLLFPIATKVSVNLSATIVHCNSYQYHIEGYNFRYNPTTL